MLTSTYIREQKRYTKEKLEEKFKCSESQILPILRKLKEFGVLKTVRASEIQEDLSDLAEEDIEIVEEGNNPGEHFYVFTFVGVIVVSGKVLKCYPKYLLNNDEPKEELSQVIKVLRKYSSKEQIVKMFNESDSSRSFNLLSVLLHLLYDYFDNGVYTNTEEIIESNGLGEILWDRTINETFTFISQGKPYYIDVQTKKRVTDTYDYFQRLHECILTKASKELKESDLLDVFEITEVDLTDEELDDFGDQEYILYRIEKELNREFNTRKRLVLETIYTYIEERKSLNDLDCLSLFGTNSFNLVWEKVCSDVFDNKLEYSLKDLGLVVPDNRKNDIKDTNKLKDVIEKPHWTITGNKANDTLVPDIISIQEKRFVILDAKYYCAKLEKESKPLNQPGIESVSKQFLYQLSYKSLIEANKEKIGFVKNCFLLPTEGHNIVNKGQVKMDMFCDYMGLEPIEVRFLPVEKVYNIYLAGSTMDISEVIEY